MVSTMHVLTFLTLNFKYCNSVLAIFLGNTSVNFWEKWTDFIGGWGDLNSLSDLETSFILSVKNTSKEPLCQNTFVIQQLGSRENEGFKLETNLGHLVKPCLNNKS